MTEQNQPPVASNPHLDSSLSASRSRRLLWHGDGFNLAILMLKNIVLSILTLGIYSFWGKVELRKYYAAQSSFEGDRFYYHGTGKETFRGFMRLALYGIVLAVAYFGIVSLAEALGLGFISILLGLVLYFGFFIASPLLIWLAVRYRLSRTSWRGLRFGLRGTAKDFAKKFVVDAILGGLSMGILMPVFYINIYKNIVENTYWGDVNFRFNAHNGTFMRIGILGYFLSLITFGIYSFWARAEWSREKYGRTKLDAGDSGRIKIHPQVTGGLMAKWFFVSFFGVIFTLGLALPWVISYNMKEWSKVLKFSGKIDYSTIRSKETKGSAIGEEAAEALDIDIGDFL